MSDEVSKCVNVWSSDEAFPMINFWNSAKCYKSAHNWPLQHFPGSKSRFSSLYCHIAPPYICRTWKRYNQNCFFSTCHFLDSSKLAITQENGNYIKICWHHVIVIFFFFFFFWSCFVSLVRFSYWSEFYVNIITGSGVMTIFF